MWDIGGKGGRFLGSRILGIGILDLGPRVRETRSLVIRWDLNRIFEPRRDQEGFLPWRGRKEPGSLSHMYLYHPEVKVRE